MSLTITLVPFQLSPTEDWTVAKFNQGFNPTVSFTGSVGTADLSSGAVTAAKLTPDAYAYAAATGTDTYAATFSPAFSAYINGLQVHVKFANANATTTPTLNANSLGAKKLRFRGDIALRAGDIPANTILALTYNSSLDAGTGGWEIQDALENYTAVVAQAKSLRLQTNATNPTYQVDISAEEVVLKTAAGVPLLASSVSVTADISLGVALNGLETGGTEAASHWYYIWLISDGTNVRSVLEDAGADPGADPGGPDLSGGTFTGYTYKALVGVVRNTSGSDFLPFVQNGNRVAIGNSNVFTAQAAAGANNYEILAGANLTAFRAAVPPNAIEAYGTAGSSNTADAARLTVCAVNADGTESADSIGESVISIASVGFSVGGFNSAGTFTVPVRGGASARNIQWACANNTNQNRLSISAFILK